MLDFLKGAFSKNKNPIIKYDHEILGSMHFVKDGGYWESDGEDLYHSIPGDERSPNQNSVEFIVSKIERIGHYFELSSNDLLYIAHGWDSIDKSLSAKELFKVSAISVNPGNEEWEICFETKPGNKWIYIGLQFEGEEIVSNDIAT